MAGLAYAVAEVLFVVVLSALLQAPDLYQPLHLGVTALLFLAYPVLGALLSVSLIGIIAAIWARGNRTAMLPRAASAVGPIVVLVVVTAILGLRSSDSRAGLVAALAGAMCLGAACLGVWDPDRWRLLSPAGGVWVAAMIPLGMASVPLLAVPPGSPVLRLMAALAYGAVVLGLAYRREWLAKESSPGAGRKRGVVWALAAAGMLLAAGAAIDRGLYIQAPRSLASADARKRPNVLMISLDTVRADHLSLYGYQRDTTPNLKKLAAEATVYRRATSTADWTLPSHASMFTGLYSSEHGAYCDVKSHGLLQLPDATETVAERLRDEGYATLGVVANTTMLIRVFNIHQGFQYYSTRLPMLPLYAGPANYSVRKVLLSRLQEYWTPDSNPDLYVKGSAITKEASSLIGQVSEFGEPWFLFANYMDAHAPYNPPDPYATRYSAQPVIPLNKFYELAKEVMQLKRTIPKDVLDPLVGKYDGGIAYLDDQIGLLCDHLRQLGVYDDTMIIITADHGEAFGEHMLMEHGVSVYEDQIHVPLIIKWPRGIKRPPDPLPVSGVDIKSTILEVTGLKSGARVSGRSLLSNHESGEIRIAGTYPCRDIYNTHPRFRRVEQAVMSGPWKLIASSTGKRELYNIESDPAEAKNLYETDREPAKELEARLENWRKTIGPVRSRKAAELTAEELERLKTLGYVQ